MEKCPSGDNALPVNTSNTSDRLHNTMAHVADINDVCALYKFVYVIHKHTRLITIIIPIDNDNCQ